MTRGLVVTSPWSPLRPVQPAASRSMRSRRAGGAEPWRDAPHVVWAILVGEDGGEGAARLVAYTLLRGHMGGGSCPSFTQRRVVPRLSGLSTGGGR